MLGQKGRMKLWEHRTSKFHKPTWRINEELLEGYTEMVLLDNDKVIVDNLIVKEGDRLELLCQSGGHMMRVSKSDKIVCLVKLAEDIGLEVVKKSGGREIIIKEG